MAGFGHFYYNDCTSLSELITFETVNQFHQAFLIWGQESDLSNLFIIINTEKRQTRKKVKNGQKLTNTAEILYVYFNDCTGPVKGHNFCTTHSIWPLVFAMTLPNRYLHILVMD
jgi:hypothetical protein